MSERKPSHDEGRRRFLRLSAYVGAASIGGVLTGEGLYLLLKEVFSDDSVDQCNTLAQTASQLSPEKKAELMIQVDAGFFSLLLAGENWRFQQALDEFNKLTGEHHTIEELKALPDKDLDSFSNRAFEVLDADNSVSDNLLLKFDYIDHPSFLYDQAAGDGNYVWSLSITVRAGEKPLAVQIIGGYNQTDFKEKKSVGLNIRMTTDAFYQYNADRFKFDLNTQGDSLSFEYVTRFSVTKEHPRIISPQDPPRDGMVSQWFLPHFRPFRSDGVKFESLVKPELMVSPGSSQDCQRAATVEEVTLIIDTLAATREHLKSSG